MMKSTMAPIPVRAIKSHQGEKPASLRRRTLTARDGKNVNTKVMAQLIKIAVVEPVPHIAETT